MRQSALFKEPALFRVLLGYTTGPLFLIFLSEHITHCPHHTLDALIQINLCCSLSIPCCDGIGIVRTEALLQPVYFGDGINFADKSKKQVSSKGVPTSHCDKQNEQSFGICCVLSEPSSSAKTPQIARVILARSFPLVFDC